MLTRTAITTLFLVVFLALPTLGQFAEENPASMPPRTFAVSFAPSLGYNFGHTTYDFAIYPLDTAVGMTSFLRSKLKFPVDQFMVGGSVRLQSYLGDVEDWSFQISGQVSVTDPAGTMTDIDWVTVHGGYDGMFSYTESNAQGSNIIANFQFTKRLFGHSRTALGVVAGFRYQRIKQDVDNFVGWQVRPTDPNPTPVTIDVDGTPALVYRVTYLMPQAGVHLTTRPSRMTSVDVRALYALTIADDYDNHLLRYKDATGDGRGNAFLANVRGEWLLNERRPGSRPFIAVEADLVTLKVLGDQRQEWYADEVGPEGTVAKGTVYSGLPHDFISTQLRVGAQFGFRF